MDQELREDGRRFELTCFFEVLQLPGLRRVVVTKESTTLEGFMPHSIHTNYSNMVKFSLVGDNGFTRMLGELMRGDGSALSGRKAMRGVVPSGGVFTDSPDTARPVKRHYAVPLETVASYTQRDELWRELGEKLRIRH